MEDSRIKTNYPALYTLVIVFFFWGFIAASNSVFIPFCKHYFSLDQFQSQLVDFAFYTAYYVGALFLFIFGTLRGRDVVGAWGYKRSIVYGLLFSTLGAAAMIVALLSNVYIGILAGLFIVALGYSLQQTAANPFAIALGDPKTGSDRINLGGGVNSFGTTIGPIIISIALFGGVSQISGEQIQGLNLNSVTLLYMCVGVLYLAAAGIFFFSKKVPACIQESEVERSDKALAMLVVVTVALFALFAVVFGTYRIDAGQLSPAEVDALEMKRMLCLMGAFAVVIAGLVFAHAKSKGDSRGWGAMQYPQLLFGMIALFVYVGVEVCIASNLGELLSLPEFGSYTPSQIAPFVSMYWGSLLIGRWTGAVLVFNLKKTVRILAQIAAPLAALLLVVAVNIVSGQDMAILYYYIVCVAVEVAAFIFCKERPALTLFVFAVLGIVAMGVGLCTSGVVAIYAFLSGGLFCSIMWSNIYTLATLGLGKYTSQGSSFLVMMILGGGIIPPIQGKLADIIGVHNSYVVPIICFAYIAFYALYAKRILAKQHIEID